MEANPVLSWAIAVFVLMGAIAMIIQAVTSFYTYKAIRGMKDRIDPLIPQAQSTLQNAQAAISESRDQIREISTRTIEILDSTKVQMARVEEVVIDATGRAKNQLARTELILEDTVSRLHETVSAVQGTVLKPIREVNGIAAGVRAGVMQFLKGNRPSVDKVTQDEEMFI